MQDLGLDKELEKVMEAAMRGPDEAGCGLAVSRFRCLWQAKPFRPKFSCLLGSVVSGVRPRNRTWRRSSRE